VGKKWKQGAARGSTCSPSIALSAPLLHPASSCHHSGCVVGLKFGNAAVPFADSSSLCVEASCFIDGLHRIHRRSPRGSTFRRPSRSWFRCLPLFFSRPRLRRLHVLTKPCSLALLALGGGGSPDFRKSSAAASLGRRPTACRAARDECGAPRKHWHTHPASLVLHCLLALSFGRLRQFCAYATDGGRLARGRSLVRGRTAISFEPQT